MPFCRHRCDYCAFATWSDRDHLIDRYMAACRTHAAIVASGLDRPVTSVFVGGGTPSRVPAASLLTVLGELPIAAGAEVTVECNPEDLTPALAAAYADGGVTRVSLGVQSMVPHVLEALGRQHPMSAVAPAVAAARSAALDVNLDVIYGGAGETLDDWAVTIDGVIALGPDHVSAYGLMVEPGTPLALDEARHPDDDDQADKYELAGERLEAAGLAWYEISNWAVPGHECRHNLLYWTMGEYLALGCAAHGHSDGVRMWTWRTPERYLAAVEAGEDPVVGSEELTPDERAVEAAQLAIRTRAGVPASALAASDREALDGFVVRADDVDGERVVLTPAGRLLANEVAVRLRAPDGR